jgi:two-component system, response regulator PdtaR
MNGSKVNTSQDTQLALLHAISRTVSAKLTLDEILQELIGIAVGFTRCDACLVYLLEPATCSVVLRASQLPHSAELGRIRLKLGEGITGWVAQHKSVAALSRKAFADPRFKFFNLLVEDTYHAFLSVPLVSGGELVGVLNVHHKEPRNHSPAEIALLSFVGEQMGGVIAKSQLAEENSKLQEKAADMQDQLETRKLVERAKGILQRRYELTEEQAYLRLRDESRRTRRPVRELAQVIVAAEGVALGKQIAPINEARSR